MHHLLPWIPTTPRGGPMEISEHAAPKVRSQKLQAVVPEGARLAHETVEQRFLPLLTRRNLDVVIPRRLQNHGSPAPRLSRGSYESGIDRTLGGLHAGMPIVPPPDKRDDIFAL